MDPIATALSQRGFLPHYARLFSEDGAPAALPQHHSHLVVSALEAEAAAGAQRLASWVRALPPPRLTTLLRHRYMGKPRLRMSAAELEADFDLLARATPEQCAAEGAAAEAASLAAAPHAPAAAAALALGSGAVAADGASHTAAGAADRPAKRLKLTSALALPSSTLAASRPEDADPLSLLSAEAAAILREEDRLFESHTSAELEAVVDAETSQRFHAEVLSRAHAKLRVLSWAPHWKLNGGNPFVLKITAGNCAEYGVPDYFDFVEKAMDLTRIEERIARRAYASPAEFFRDTALIALNAKVFNGPDCARRKTNPHFPAPMAELPPDDAKVPAAELRQLQMTHVHSLYGMAFDFEREAEKLRKPVLACYVQLRRLSRRAMLTKMLQLGPQEGGAHEFLRPDFRKRLQAATAEFASKHGINIVA